MQVVPEADVGELLDRLVEDELPGGRGLGAWDSFLRAHATLLRRLDTDLEGETGLALADFDVLAQLAEAHGALRMTELADRALISRSGMTRRVARLVGEGLVRRADADADGRGVVVALTEAGSLLAASMGGSQLGPYVSGAGRVILVVGTQKIVSDLEEGLRRINEYAFPLEDARAQAAYGIHSAVNKVLIINREIVPGRITVVLVDEVLGF